LVKHFCYKYNFHRIESLVSWRQDSQIKNQRQGEFSMSEKIGPTHEQIQQRAYELFLERGGDHGGHEDDWLAAEQELTEAQLDGVLQLAPARSASTEDGITEEAVLDEDAANGGAAVAQPGEQTKNRTEGAGTKTTSPGFPSAVSSRP
jgi:hypothetical protein